jgi:hypothetical protein
MFPLLHALDQGEELPLGGGVMPLIFVAFSPPATKEALHPFLLLR